MDCESTIVTKVIKNSTLRVVEDVIRIISDKTAFIEYINVHEVPEQIE